MAAHICEYPCLRIIGRTQQLHDSVWEKRLHILTHRGASMPWLIGSLKLCEVPYHTGGPCGPSLEMEKTYTYLLGICPRWIFWAFSSSCQAIQDPNMPWGNVSSTYRMSSFLKLSSGSTSARRSYRALDHGTDDTG